MKAQILKIAGVKSEKEFYKKYPSEEAFMKVHGKAFKKAQMGTYIGGDTNAAPKLVDFNSMYDQADLSATGMTDAMRQAQAEKASSASKDSGGGGGMDMSGIMDMFGGGGEGGAEGMAAALGRYGVNIPRAAGGTNVNNWWSGMTTDNTTTTAPGFDINKYGIGAQTMGKMGGTSPTNKTASPGNYSSSDIDNNGVPDLVQQSEGNPLNKSMGPSTAPEGGGFGKDLEGLTKGIPVIGGIVSGLNALEAERQAAKAASQSRQVSDLQLKASTTRPEMKERKYVRPEDVRNTGEEFFPIYGVGTNVLARNGMRLQDGDNLETRPGGMMGRAPIIPEVDAPIPVQEKLSNFDSKSARDNWVQKTGLPWSEAKRLGYTTGSAKDNTKLLGELNDPRFKKENLRSAPPKSSSQSRTPVQHRETPTGKLAPIKPNQSWANAIKGKPTYKGNNAMLSTSTKNQMQREEEAKRSQAENDDYLLGERALYYMANPSKAFGDLKSLLNPNFTGEDETSEGFRKEVMANRYNPNQTNNQRIANATKRGLGLVPKAAANVATALSATPYTTFEPMAIGIGEGVAPRAAGYLGQGARQIGQGAAKQIGQGASKMIGQGYVPNFTMYENGGMIGGNPTEIQNTYGDGNSIYDDLGYVPLINNNQQKSFYYGGGIPKAQSRWQNYTNTLSGGGSGFSGAGEAGGPDYASYSNIASNAGQAAMGGQNAGGQIGGEVGGAIGSAFGPAGKGIGKFVGTIAGNALDPYAKAIKNDNAVTKGNVENIAMNQIAPAIQAGYASHVRNGGDIPSYEDGGYMNPEYNPQVITMFGDHNAQDFADYAHKFRAGGHLKSYTPPSERAMETYEDGGEVRRSALNGEVQTTWGGGIKTLSHNPYMPGTGETIQFVGNSHDTYDPKSKQTGIGVKYGQGNQDSYTDYAEYGTEQADANVEVEKEPAAELIDPVTGEKNLTVWGNLKIPNQYIDLLGDKSAKGKKFKNYVADLSKIEAKQNKMIEKSTNDLNSLDVNSSFDRLKLSSLQANINGANMKLKDIADKKISAAHLQNAINDTAEENGLVADDLARGKIKIDKEAMQTREARWGDAISKAQSGKKIKFKSEKEALDAGYIKDANGYYKIIPPEQSAPIETKVAEAQKDIPLQHADASGLYGDASTKLAQAQRNNPWFDFTGFNPANKADVERFQKAFNEKAKSIGSTASIKVDGKFGNQTASALIDEKRKVQPSVGTREEAELEPEPTTTPVSYKRSPWIDFGNQLLDYIRPTDQEPLDYNQLMGEMYALSNNQVDPVQAQLYRPELAVPYDISYQDVLNENQADFNAQVRKSGYNPAAQANLNAQKYQANQRVLGDQFRANQAMKDKVYGENRQTLNQAKATNLGILDKQYERQSGAVSNTKATTQAALNSISDKYAKNKLENRELGIYENLYKYRYDDKGRAINMNGIFQPNIPTVGSGNATQRQVPIYKADGKTIDHYQLQEMTPEEIAAQKEQDSPLVPLLSTPGFNGNAQTKTKKNSRNGSIVKAIKNL